MADGQELASEYADDVSRSIKKLMKKTRSLNEAKSEAAFEELSERPLEVVWQEGSPFEVVLTVGGPDARIVHDVRFGGFVLEVLWGGGKACRRGEFITAMGEFFLEQVQV